VKDRENQESSQEFFRNAPVCELHLEVASAGFEALKKESRRFVEATVREGSNTYTKVGVHLKGNSTLRPIDGDKPSLTLKFNLNTAGQRFHGLNKISLNNSLHDPSYINEELCGGLFRALGVPVGRVTHARVWLNERYLGFYVLVEGMTKDFLKLNFKSSNGNLYEANAQDIDEKLEQINGTQTGQTDLKTLTEATREADASHRWQRLQTVLDVDRFISMLAGDILMSHWDGYYNDANNYRIYHDTATGKMVLIPHGLDNMFQLADVPWRPELHALLAKAVLQTSEGQELYRERFWSAFEGPFRTELLLSRIEHIVARIRPAIAADGATALQQFEKEAATIRERVINRMSFLSRELASLTPRLNFGAAGLVKLAGWQIAIEAGEPQMDRSQDGSKTTLHINASKGGKAAWLTRVDLEAGKYVFLGQARSLRVVPESATGGGAGLRRAGDKPAETPLLGDSSWRPLTYEFEVAGNGGITELRCELDCKQGEAWFDTDSLRLRKLK